MTKSIEEPYTFGYERGQMKTNGACSLRIGTEYIGAEKLYDPNFDLVKRRIGTIQNW